MSAMNNTRELPDYDNPPLIEVVCGIIFKPIIDFKIPHYGLYWSAIKEEFPGCMHAPPLGDLPTNITDLEFPLPRVWLISKSESSLIQLQHDRFHFNWRRVSDDDQYPRFKNVFNPFKEYFRQFHEFIDANEIGQIVPTECELTYINHIIEGEGWQTPADMGNIMRDLIWIPEERYLPPADSINWGGIFGLPNDGGKLNIKLQSAMRKSDSKKLIALELSARKKIEKQTTEQMFDWYELAHSHIVRAFADLTQQKIQREIWRRK